MLTQQLRFASLLVLLPISPVTSPSNVFLYVPTHQLRHTHELTVVYVLLHAPAEPMLRIYLELAQMTVN